MKLGALPKETLSEIGIFFVTILWGLTFPLIRLGVRDFDAVYFVFFRFSIAALAFLPIVTLIPKVRRELWAAAKPGLSSGVIVSLVYIFQTIGLETVPSARGAFVTSAYVILVPLLSPLFGRMRPTRAEWFAGLTALAGLFLLLDPNTADLNVGDLWIISCALTCAISIHVMKLVANRTYDLTAISFWQVVSVAGVAGVWTLFIENPVLTVDSTFVWCLLINALGVTVLSTLIPIHASRYLPPERTALIYAFEPVFALIFGFFILDEVLAVSALAGGALIVLAIMGGPALRLSMSQFRRPRP